MDYGLFNMIIWLMGWACLVSSFAHDEQGNKKMTFVMFSCFLFAMFFCIATIIYQDFLLD